MGTRSLRWSVLILLLGVWACAEEPGPQLPNQQQAQHVVPGGGKGELVALPVPDSEGFSTKSGKKGWRVKIPGGRALATAAIMDGILFVGGGFGSHEFYALNAATGMRVWTFKTGDDGPTAAVAAEGCVAYNTESCTIYVHDARTGKVYWHRWLGDPLMSQPAIGKGLVLMAYPGESGHVLAAFKLKENREVWKQPIAGEVITAPVIDGDAVYAVAADGTLYRFALENGKKAWEHKGSITSAPVIRGDRIYVSQRIVKKIEIKGEKDGKAAVNVSEAVHEGYNIIEAVTGKPLYKGPQATVKAAYLMTHEMAQANIVGNMSNSYFGQRAYRGGAAKQVTESIAKVPQSKRSSKLEHLEMAVIDFSDREPGKDIEGSEKDAEDAIELADKIDEVRSTELGDSSESSKKINAELAKSSAELRATAGQIKEATATVRNSKSKLKALQNNEDKAQREDSSVGFATAPAAANLGVAVANLGQAHVKALWAYQGSRPVVKGDICYMLAGDSLRAINLKTEKIIWQTTIKVTQDAVRAATPPALAGDRLYLATGDGHILCVDARNGKILWDEEVGGGIIFQLSMAEGRIYATTDDGNLICLETGDPSVKGWSMWGGSAQHNGRKTKE